MRAFYFILSCFVYSLNFDQCINTSDHNTRQTISSLHLFHIKFNSTTLQNLYFKRTGRRNFSKDSIEASKGIENNTTKG